MNRTREILATTDLLMRAKMLYLVLCEYAEGGRVQISSETLAELMSTTPHTIRRSTKDLLEAGFIETDEEGRAWRTAKIYRLI